MATATSLPEDAQAIASADWRFLLPGDETSSLGRVVVLGASEETCAALEKAGVAETVASGRSAGPAPDAVVVPGVGASAASVAAMVRPGGTIYWRSSRAGVRGYVELRVIRRHLRAAGLTTVALHCELGTPARPHAYVPLERGACTWYLDRYADRSTFFRFAVHRIRLGAVRLWPGLIAMPRGRYGLRATARDRVRPASLDLVPRQNTSGDGCVIVAPGDALNRVALFPFLSSSRPSGEVLKFSRSAPVADATVWEQQTLSRIREQLGSTLSGSVPAPLGIPVFQGLAAGVESVVAGTPLDRLLDTWPHRRSRAHAALDATVSWLVQFTARSSSVVTWGAFTDEWVDHAFERCEQALGTTPAVVALLGHVRARSALLVDAPTPITLVHWGFRGGNVFVERDRRVAVIDWEASGDGPPLMDLLDLLLWWGSAVAEAPMPLVLERLVAGGDDDVTNALMKMIDVYVRGIDLDPRLVPVLIVVYCVTRARSRAARDQELGKATPNVYFDLLHALARDQEQLFARWSGSSPPQHEGG